MHNGVLSILTSVLLALSGPAAASHCVFPVPDGGDTEPSPPSLTGTILSVAPDQVVVRVSGAKHNRQVAMSPSTELSTVYGGGIEIGDLHPGQHALIWFEGCTTPKQGPPVAAVLQVCSLAPEPCAR
jgi:hypothetical protein